LVEAPRPDVLIAAGVGLVRRPGAVGRHADRAAERDGRALAGLDIVEERPPVERAALVQNRVAIAGHPEGVVAAAIAKRAPQLARLDVDAPDRRLPVAARLEEDVFAIWRPRGILVVASVGEQRGLVALDIHEPEAGRLVAALAGCGDETRSIGRPGRNLVAQGALGEAPLLAAL